MSWSIALPQADPVIQPRSQVRTLAAVTSGLHFGAPSDEEYFQVRLQHTVSRWKDGYERLVEAEKQAFASYRCEHIEIVSDYKRALRNAYRQMLLDFEVLCTRDKTDSGLAVEEECHRGLIYEAWLSEYQSMVPAEAAHRKLRLEEQRRVLQQQVDAARRARVAYEECLQTTDDMDMCRREQTRGRQRIYQEWHDAVVVGLGSWHAWCVRVFDTSEYELWMRCHVELEEEDVRAAVLQTACHMTQAAVEESYTRIALEHAEAFEFRESILGNAKRSLDYELWWLTTKEVPSRWRGENVDTRAS